MFDKKTKTKKKTSKNDKDSVQSMSEKIFIRWETGRNIPETMKHTEVVLNP